MKPGAKPQGKVLIKWSPHFAYAVGLLTADGCLSKDGRHLDLTSKDRIQIIFKDICCLICFNINAPVEHIRFFDFRGIFCKLNALQSLQNSMALVIYRNCRDWSDSSFIIHLGQ